MSSPATEITTPSPADEPDEAAGSPVRRPKLARIGYGVSLVAVVALIAGLGIYEANSTGHPDEPAPPPAAAPPPPPEHDPAVLEAMLDENLLQDAHIEPTDTGLTLTASVTDVGVADTAALGGHLGHLLANNCLDNVALITPSNMHIQAWGMCHSVLPAEPFIDGITYAQETNATAISWSEHQQNNGSRGASVTWMPSTEGTYEEILRSWEDLELPESLNLITLKVYGTGGQSEYMDYADLNESGLFLGEDSINSKIPELRS